MFGLLDLWWPQYGEVLSKYAHNNHPVTQGLFMNSFLSNWQ